jgi:hypothetical protein
MKNIKQKYNTNITYYNLLIKKILVKQYNKLNIFFLNKFKFQKKSEDKNEVSDFNKILISSIALLFIYMFYLLIPTLYDKSWVQNNIETKLSNEFKIDFSVSSKISYEILPSPNFTLEDVKILTNIENNPVEVAEIKKLKVYISQKNFFNQKKLKINKILIKDSNFTVMANDTSFYQNFFDKKFSDKEVFIKNSNIFVKSYNGEIISLFKISKLLLFHDRLDFTNKIDVKAKAFKVPFNIKLEKIFAKDLIETNTSIKVKKLKLDIQNQTNIKLDNNQKIINGTNIISLLNSKLITKYQEKKNFISFSSNELKLRNNNFKYKGELNLKPFYLDTNIYFEEFKITKLMDTNSPFLDLFKTNLLFNENISSTIKIIINKDTSNKLFDSSKIVLNINNGKINFNESALISKKVGLLKVENSQLFFENNNLILRCQFVFDIKNHQKFFSYFLTPKKFRKPIKKIAMSMDYNFFEDDIIVNNFKIDDRKQSQRNLEIINNFNRLENNEFKNFIKNKNFLNKLFANYDG